MEAELVRKADAVLFTSTGLKAKAIALDARKAKYFPNGVEYHHFATATPLPLRYETITGPIAVYVGELGIRFDFELLKATAELVPEVTFVLIGPTADMDDLKLPRNVQFFGPIDYALLPQYLQHATVGIIPLNVRLKADLVNGVNPLKLYQYMAAGLPVIATSWDALAALGSPAVLVADSADFAVALRRCIGDAPDAALYRRFAAQYDWSVKITELESIATTN
jgi:glycosyltransferase involved in cell wall biosynthesis